MISEYFTLNILTIWLFLKAHRKGGSYYSLDIQTLHYQYKELMRSLIFKIQLFIVVKVLAPSPPYRVIRTKTFVSEGRADPRMRRDWCSVSSSSSGQGLAILLYT